MNSKKGVLDRSEHLVIIQYDDIYVKIYSLITSVIILNIKKIILYELKRWGDRGILGL